MSEKEKKEICLPEIVEDLKERCDYNDDLLIYIYLNPANLHLIEEYYTVSWLTTQNTATANIRLNYSFGFCNEDTNVVVIMSTDVKKETTLSIHPEIVNMEKGMCYLN